MCCRASPQDGAAPEGGAFTGVFRDFDPPGANAYEGALTCQRMHVRLRLRLHLRLRLR